jgi:hypothetical protein
MDVRFNNCIAIGVEDKARAAAEFVSLFGATLGDSNEEYTEVLCGPLRFYFVEDGTKDIAFSVDLPNSVSEREFIATAMANGYILDESVSERCSESFLRSPDGILVNLFPTSK